jgi:hypothetical protein
VKPSVSGVFAGLFTAVTGIDMTYEQKVIREKKGTMQFPDGRKTKIRLRWIEMQERSVKDSQGTSRITEPLITELYDGDTKTGDFLYTFRENVHSTDQTEMKLNVFAGFQIRNSLGVEKAHRIDGFMRDTEIFAEFSEYYGIIEVSRDTVLLAMMVAQNCNPESQSFGQEKLSKSKKFVSSGTSIGKQSLDKSGKVEWYPVYIPADASAETGELCLKILSCLFFGMGTQGQPAGTSE